MALRTLFTRRPSTPADAAPTQPVDDGVLIRFRTQGGATVLVAGSGDRRDTNGHHWKCYGCGDTDDWRYLSGRSLSTTRGVANTHAANCRAMPKRTA